MTFRNRSFIIAYSAPITKNKGIRPMRLTLLLVMTSCMAPLSACADDSTESMDAPDSIIAADDSAAADAQPIELVEPTNANYVLVNGKRVRMVTDGGKGLNSDGTMKFRHIIGFMSRRNGISVDEVRRLNSWEGLEEEMVPEGGVWIHPDFLREPT